MVLDQLLICCGTFPSQVNVFLSLDLTDFILGEKKQNGEVPTEEEEKLMKVLHE